MNSQPRCSCQATPKLIFPCLGVSDFGGLTDRTARIREVANRKADWLAG